MMSFRLLSTLAVTGGLLFSAGGSDSNTGNPAGADRAVTARTAPAPAVAPVLRDDEPADTSLVLPGAKTMPVAAPQPIPAKPAPVQAAPVQKVAATGFVPPPDPERPILRRAPTPSFPEEFEKDSATFCHNRIGQWKVQDARALFGVPKSQRAAYDDHNAVNGVILAFSDPTSHYKQLELDFDGDTGALRTVFVYPWKMTWQDCRREFGINVTATGANKGRMFYSYLNRRLDVLVDRSGQVISLGMY